MGNDVLCRLDVFLAALIQLLDLIGRDFGKLSLELFSLHGAHILVFVYVIGQVDSRIAILQLLITLLSQAFLQNLEDLSLLVLLLIVEIRLNVQLFFLLLLSVLSAELLCTFLSMTCMHTAAAPKKHKSQHCESKDQDDMLQKPISD